MSVATVLGHLRHAARVLWVTTGWTVASMLVLTAAAVVIEPLPRALEERRLGAGLVVEDAAGRRLGQIRGADYRLALPVSLRDVPQTVKNAVIAAEDARFFRHRGIDPLAIARATWQLIRTRRIVSGASTITQQLGRVLVLRQRTVYGKWRELVIGLRIEANLGKDAILEAYLNHVPFGATTCGIGAAADEYFGKPVMSLSLAEAAALAALPKGPVWYHPRRHELRLLARRNRILDRMLALDFVDLEAARRARLEPITVRPIVHETHAAHLLRAIQNGRFYVESAQLRSAARVRTTLDGDLQRRVEKVVEDAKGELARVGASAAAVVVLDNAHAELLSYVGSVDFFDATSLGQNDGCLALRQPGSALKPFVYAAGIEWLKMGPATQLVDVETRFETKTASFAPKNYDGRYHGLVLLREALGSSLNVPAVAVAERVGVERLLALLHRVGLRSLDRPASDYGLALALGDGEVRLLELAEAYSTLARHGRHHPVRAITAWTNSGGERRRVDPGTAMPVMSESTAWQILEILSDDAARAPAFGRHGTLEFPFAAAVKTGTSSNHRDNWAAAVTHEITAAVWVGNFDGSPLAHGTSGIVGAAPLLRSVMLAAMGNRSRAALFPRDRLSSRQVCRASGQLPGPDCPDRVEIEFIEGLAPVEKCTLHRRIWVDPHNGLLATERCVDKMPRVIEQYPEQLTGWARTVGRPLLPTEESPRCPGALAEHLGVGRLELESPEAEARYLVDPHIPVSQQNLWFAVKASPKIAWVIYDVDGTTSGRIGPPFRWSWPLRAGVHRVMVKASNGATDEARCSVE